MRFCVTYGVECGGREERVDAWNEPEAIAVGTHVDLAVTARAFNTRVGPRAGLQLASSVDVRGQEF